MIFVYELPKSIRLNGLFALSGACLFIVCYEIMLVIEAYGAVAVIIGCALVGAMLHSLVVLIKINHDSRQNFGSMQMAVAFMSVVPRRRFIDRLKGPLFEVFLRALSTWMIVALVILLISYRGDVPVRPFFGVVLATLIAGGASAFLEFQRRRRFRRELEEIGKLTERLPND